MATSGFMESSFLVAGMSITQGKNRCKREEQTGVVFFAAVCYNQTILGHQILKSFLKIFQRHLHSRPCRVKWFCFEKEVMQCETMMITMS